MKKKRKRVEPSDEQDKTNFARSTDDPSVHTSLITEQRLAETHNAISNPDGDDAAENKVATSLDDE
ncbi:MAG: hypothetical protein M3342_20035 [Bacteroidota bacterium]|nr:hypothetical protein [Bacteroidota bacterium]